MHLTMSHANSTQIKRPYVRHVSVLLKMRLLFFSHIILNSYMSSTVASDCLSVINW